MHVATLQSVQTSQRGYLHFNGCSSIIIRSTSFVQLAVIIIAFIGGVAIFILTTVIAQPLLPSPGMAPTLASM